MSTTFDSEQVLAEPGAVPCIAFISFFSNVEHQVLPVTSGHHLTITYNLYFSPTRTIHSPPPPAMLHVLQPSGVQPSTVLSVLTALLADPSILPNGGMLGFGLQHQYPFLKSWTRGDADPLASTASYI